MTATVRTPDARFVRDRAVTFRWTATTTTTDEFGDTTQDAVELSVRHSKERKTLVANLSPVQLVTSRYGYSALRWSSDNPGWRTATKSVARYSQKALDEFAAEALADLTRLVNTAPAVREALDKVDAVNGTATAPETTADAKLALLAQ